MMSELGAASGAAGAGIALHGDWRQALARAIERARNSIGGHYRAACCGVRAATR